MPTGNDLIASTPIAFHMIKPMRILLGCLLFFVLSCAFVSAQPPSDEYTGNELLRFCESGLNFNQGVCGGFAVGVMRAYQAVGISQHRYWFCAPPGATNGQVVAVVTKYLRDHPERLHLDNDKLVLDALMAAWPCGK